MKISDFLPNFGLLILLCVTGLTASCGNNSPSSSGGGSATATPTSTPQAVLSGSVSYYGNQTITSGTSYIGVAVYTNSSLNEGGNAVSVAAGATIIATSNSSPVTGNFSLTLPANGTYYLAVDFSSSGLTTGQSANSGMVDAGGPLPGDSYYIYNTGTTTPATGIVVSGATTLSSIIAFNDTYKAAGIAGPVTYSVAGVVPSSALSNKWYVWAYTSGTFPSTSGYITESQNTKDPAHLYLTNLAYSTGAWDGVVFYDANGSGDVLTNGDPETIITGVTPSTVPASQGVSFDSVATTAWSGGTVTK